MSVNATHPFASRLLAWFSQHGRHDLPWQQPRTPYRVWVSEVMLQQTQVETVIPYFLRFTATFPDLPSLARGSLPEVLRLWAGLGYYARARNLHRTAVIVQDRFSGELPDSRRLLESLPGIGRSTAAAILAQAFGQPEPILDGNVRRVLARHAAIDGWPGNTRVQQSLWALAETRMPQEHTADYTQAIMDLGATVCLRTKPRCALCPVQTDCQAFLTDRCTTLPTPRPSKALPVRTRWAAVVLAADKVYLEQRPPVGIWGGLYSLPEHETREGLENWLSAHFPDIRFRLKLGSEDHIDHTFSHYRLKLHLLRIRIPVPHLGVRDAGVEFWLPLTTARAQEPAVALPTPILNYLREFADSEDLV